MNDKIHIDLDNLEQDLKTFIVKTLRLEDVEPDEIDVEAPLFFEGLGLDSLDALELGVALSKNFGIKLNNDPEENQKIFASVRAIADYLRKELAK